jgi:hypothetical protein
VQPTFHISRIVEDRDEDNKDSNTDEKFNHDENKRKSEIDSHQN